MFTLWMLNVELGTSPNSNWKTGSYYFLPEVIKEMREPVNYHKTGAVIVPEDCSPSAW